MQSVGVYGSKVRVGELTPGGNLYVIWVDANRRQQKQSLGHKNRQAAKAMAMELSNKMATNKESIRTGRLTLDRLVYLYTQEGHHDKENRHTKDSFARLKLVVGFLGGSRLVDSISPSDIARFVQARRAGTIAARPSTVSAGTIWHDLVALKTALAWAVKHRDSRGGRLLTANPMDGISIPREKSPARPVASDEYYFALRSVAPQLPDPFVTALDLAHATGHRIGAILRLKWDDVLPAGPGAPYGQLHWSKEFDKVDNDHTVPINAAAQEAIAALRSRAPGLGAAWLFPSPSDPTHPLDRHLVSRWLRRAEQLAGIEHVKGRGWHSFRRAWASARKHSSDVDVAVAGGWKDTATMKRCYQHADSATVLRVVLGSEAAVGEQVRQEVIQAQEA
jgi:integrase